MSVIRSWRIIALRLPKLGPQCVWVACSVSDAATLIERYTRVSTPAAVIVTGGGAQVAEDLSGTLRLRSRRAAERAAAQLGAELELAGYRVLADPALSARIGAARHRNGASGL